MTETIVLITGGTRGLGRALVQRFLALPNHTVIAANRRPGDAASQSLTSLPKGEGSALIVVRYDAAAENGARDAVRELREAHGVARLDVVVPNAAISREYPYARDVRRAAVLEHVEANVLSVVSLFQAARDLLRASARPVFAPMGSGAGYLGSVYGPSKAMLFWYGVRINAEEEWLNTFVIDPGWVRTDMGNDAARRWGLKEATLPIDESMDGVVHLLRTATKEKHGGRSVLYTGEVQEW